MPFDYPRDVAPALLKSIDEDAPNGLADRSVAPVPSQREVEALLDVTFMARFMKRKAGELSFALPS